MGDKKDSYGRWDDTVEMLFRDIGGPEVSSEKRAVPGLIETLHEEEGRLDPWRVLLVKFSRAFAGFIADSRAGAEEAAKRAAEEVTDLLVRLSGMPNHDGRIIIRHMGGGDSEGGEASRKRDYTVSFSGLTLDTVRVGSVALRIGEAVTGLEDKFAEAMNILADCGVNSVCVFVDFTSAEARGRLERSLEALEVYFAFIGTGMEGEAPAEDGTSPLIIYDEKRKPNPNFTVLAAVNELQRGEIQVLINRVAAMMRRAGARDPLRFFTGAYDAVFAFKKLWGVLDRPMVEINNPRWLVAATEDELIPETVAAVARLVSREFGDWSQRSARMLQCLRDVATRPMNAYQVLEMLGLMTELLEAVEITASGLALDLAQADVLGESTVSDILEAVKRRMEYVDEAVLESLVISGDKISSEQSPGVSLHLDGRLLDMVGFFRQRLKTNRKVMSLLRHPVEFDRTDYETIARDFSVSVDDAQDLITLFAGCFDSGGHFVRSNFEKSIPAFCKHERQVFGFLWYYVKEQMHMHDRIALLNSLQLLINRMRDPGRAIGVLLKSFIHDPESITFSDRNALMLTNVLLRKFNKELDKDIRMTPEEVLYVKDGLDEYAVEYAGRVLREGREKFFNKVRTIHRQLKGSLDPYTWHTSMPLGYMLTLEREVYILLGLVGGAAARAVLISALKEYGDPDSEIYSLAEREDQLQWLLHILQVVVRSLGRVGKEQDAEALGEVRARTPKFLSMGNAAKTRDIVKSFVRWIDQACVELGDGGASPE